VLLFFQTPFARQQKPQKPNTTTNNETPPLLHSLPLDERENERETKPPRIPSISHFTPRERKMKRTEEEDEEEARRDDKKKSI
tara:strand:- start:634 stop:882 length:249 start_codon:yes stop_codon:yes gene_type:complete